MKKCCYCKDYKKLDEFSSPKQGACKLCVKEYNKVYRSKTLIKRAEENKKWRQNNKEKHRETKYDYYSTIKGRIQNLLKSARKRAKIKSIEYDLDIAWLTELFKQQNNKCLLTNIDFVIPTERNNNKAHPFAPSLDRIDSDKGYTKENTRLVCVAINYGMNEFGEEIFSQICKSYLNLKDSLKE